MDSVIQSLEVMHSFDNRVCLMLVLMLIFCLVDLAAVAAFWMGWQPQRLTLAVHRRVLASVLAMGCSLIVGLFLWVLPSILQWAQAIASVLPIGLRLLILLQRLPGSILGSLLVLAFGGLLAYIPVKTTHGLKLLAEVLAALNLACLGLTLTIVTGLSSLHTMVQALLGHF